MTLATPGVARLCARSRPGHIAPVFELLTAHHQRRTGPIQRLRRIEVAQLMNVGVPVAGRER